MYRVKTGKKMAKNLVIELPVTIGITTDGISCYSF